MKNIFLLFIVLMVVDDCFSQDSLLLSSGKRVPYLQLKKYPDSIGVKTLDKNFVYYQPEDVFGYSESLKEKGYFLKTNPEEGDIFSYVFVDRIISGRITLFEKMKGGVSMYFEKDGRFEKIFDPVEFKEEKENRFKTFTSFFEDDQESMKYILDPDFSFKFKEVFRATEFYNLRNHKEVLPSQDDLKGKVFLYRTKFQKRQGNVVVKYFDGINYLRIEDFIELSLPLEYPTRITVSDDFYETDIILTGEFEDQYYELLYDKKTNGFIIEAKGGSELYMEFSRIQDAQAND
ncbi:MAG: hypothetical protein JXR07_07380 [Reichenbachiella sp.]